MFAPIWTWQNRDRQMATVSAKRVLPFSVICRQRLSGVTCSVIPGAPFGQGTSMLTTCCHPIKKRSLVPLSTVARGYNTRILYLDGNTLGYRAIGCQHWTSRIAVSTQIKSRIRANSVCFSRFCEAILSCLWEGVMITLVELCVTPNMVSMDQG